MIEPCRRDTDQFGIKWKLGMDGVESGCICYNNADNLRHLYILYCYRRIARDIPGSVHASKHYSLPNKDGFDGVQT
jgi:hypothetical protein